MGRGYTRAIPSSSFRALLIRGAAFIAARANFFNRYQRYDDRIIQRKGGEERRRWTHRGARGLGLTSGGPRWVARLFRSWRFLGPPFSEATEILTITGWIQQRPLAPSPIHKSNNLSGPSAAFWSRPIHPASLHPRPLFLHNYAGYGHICWYLLSLAVRPIFDTFVRLGINLFATSRADSDCSMLLTRYGGRFWKANVCEIMRNFEEIIVTFSSFDVFNYYCY